MTGRGETTDDAERQSREAIKSLSASYSEVTFQYCTTLPPYIPPKSI